MITKINKLFLIRKMFAGGLKNFAWLFAGNTGSHLLKAIITIYAARKLGTEGYGIYSYALGLAGFLFLSKTSGLILFLPAK